MERPDQIYTFGCQKVNQFLAIDLLQIQKHILTQLLSCIPSWHDRSWGNVGTASVSFGKVSFG